MTDPALDIQVQESMLYALSILATIKISEEARVMGQTFRGLIVRPRYQVAKLDYVKYLNSSLIADTFGVLGFWGDRKSVV